MQIHVMSSSKQCTYIHYQIADGGPTLDYRTQWRCGVLCGLLRSSNLCALTLLDMQKIAAVSSLKINRLFANME